MISFKIRATTESHWFLFLRFLRANANIVFHISCMHCIFFFFFWKAFRRIPTTLWDPHKVIVQRICFNFILQGSPRYYKWIRHYEWIRCCKWIRCYKWSTIYLGTFLQHARLFGTLMKVIWDDSTRTSLWISGTRLVIWNIDIHFCGTIFFSSFS